MAAQPNHHTALWLLGGAAGVFAGYEFLYKPWLTQQAANAGISPLSSFPSPTSMLSTPSYVGPSTLPGGQQGSIVDPRTSPGGDVGQAMWRKGWTQTVAQARLDAIKTGFANSNAAIAQLQANTGNPAGAGIPAAQAALAAEQAALGNAQAAYQQLMAAGNTTGAAAYAAEILGHQNDIRDLQARIAAALQPVDNSAAIAAYQGTIAGLKADYNALTGMTLA
jgi:hypothetical protein